MTKKTTKGQEGSTEYSNFSAALSKILKVSHKEMIERIKQAKSVPKQHG